MIHQSDHDRDGYHKYFFTANWDTAANYDLVVNTAGISPVGDLLVAQDVIIAIVYRERILANSLDVVCDKGVVALDGTVRTQAEIDWCVDVAQKVEEVKKVVSTMQVVDYAYYPGIC